MEPSTLTSVEEYLQTTYRPDRDYIDGEIQERNLGERDHSRLQGLIIAYLISNEARYGITVLPEQRLQVGPTRFRVPDVCIVLNTEPEEQVLTKPPFLCIEILSPDDRMSRMTQRIQDYLDMGVRHVWLLDPAERRAWDYTANAITPIKDDVLRTQDPEITMPLTPLWKR